MITSAKNKHDGLVREFKHLSDGVMVKRIGGLVPSEFKIGYDVFNKQFTGNNWEILEESDNVNIKKSSKWVLDLKMN